MIVTDPEDYRNSDAISFSKLKVFEQCPYLYWKRFVAKTIAPTEPTKAMWIGTATHCLILEGAEAFASRYVSKPETYESEKGPKVWNANAKICEAWEDNQRALGREVLTKADSDLIFRMREAVQSNEDAVKLLAPGGSAEIAIRLSHEGGMVVQGRIDWINYHINVVVDLKTIECLDDLPREIERRYYYRQLAFYRGLASVQFVSRNMFAPRCAIIGVEKTEPFRCGVYYLRNDLLDAGEDANTASLMKLSDAMKYSSWGGNPATREIGPSVELQLAMRVNS